MLIFVKVCTVDMFFSENFLKMDFLGMLFGRDFVVTRLFGGPQIFHHHQPHRGLHFLKQPRYRWPDHCDKVPGSNLEALRWGEGKMSSRVADGFGVAVCSLRIQIYPKKRILPIFLSYSREVFGFLGVGWVNFWMMLKDVGWVKQSLWIFEKKQPKESIEAMFNLWC